MDTSNISLEEKEERIKIILQEMLPNIQLDGGDMEFVSYDDDKKIVYVELKGACVGCPMSSITLKQGIEYMLKQELPEITEVINVGAELDDDDDEHSHDHITQSPFARSDHNDINSILD